jgi:hypothetical protein
MALTKTRTRTQTALTKLAEMVANVHGELAFVEGLLTGSGIGPEPAGWLQARRLKLLADRDALYATTRQFDPSIAPENIGTSDEWARQYGSRHLKTKGLESRYLSARLGQPLRSTNLG